ncbi:peptide deformylase [Alphaproteobacteria bacterium]|nr:peptide deformylase [Alphaproteobacteria bacterium]
MDKILFVPHPKLRQQAKTIIQVTQSEIDLSKKMVDIMLSAPGVGLAANQIGILKKIVSVNIRDEEKKTDNIYVLFNPKIKSYSKDKVIMEEGCLSLPKQYADIERSESITVEYMNEKNEIVEEKKNGFEARILQHEIDHLSGKLFVDYLSSLKRNMIIRRVQKLKKMGEI